MKIALNSNLLRVLIGSLLTAILASALPLEVRSQSLDESVLEEETVIVDGIEMPLSSQAAASTATGKNWYVSQHIGGPDEGVIGDFVVGPGKLELSVEPGQSKIITMTVTNRTGVRRAFEFTTEDAVGSNDPSRTVDLLGSQRGPYSLRDYITIPGKTITLDHNERAQIPVTVSIPPNADPGGRYGSVLVNTVAVEGEEGGENIVPQSPIIARIGTLFFITIPGEADRQGSLKEVTTVPNKRWFETGPIRFGILYENTGSVHLAPYGTVSVTNLAGEEVGFVELDPWFVMPGSLRLRELEWDRENLLGYYTATFSINRSYSNEIDTVSLSFWVMPWKFVLAAFISLLLILFAIRFFYRNFEFRRRGA